MAQGFLQTWRLEFRVQSWFHQTRESCFSWSESLLVPFGKLQASCHVPFNEEGIHLAIKVWMVECCRDGCPSGRFSHLCRGTLERCQSDHRFLGHLPDQGPFLLIAQFGWTASSRKSLGGSKLLPFKNDGGHCVLGDLQCSRNILVPVPRSVSWQNPVSELYGQFLQTHGLFVFLLWHALSTVGW